MNEYLTTREYLPLSLSLSLSLSIYLPLSTSFIFLRSSFSFRVFQPYVVLSLSADFGQTFRSINSNNSFLRLRQISTPESCVCEDSHPSLNVWTVSQVKLIWFLLTCTILMGTIRLKLHTLVLLLFIDSLGYLSNGGLLFRAFPAFFQLRRNNIASSSYAENQSSRIKSHFFGIHPSTPFLFELRGRS